jgi:hypothetical protein
MPVGRSADDETDGRPPADVKRIVRRGWLVLSACWVLFVFIRLLAEPDLSRMIMDRPLRILGAALASMLGPPVIVYALGLLALLAARRVRRKFARRA